ncbi:MAG TPA: hypothetical protein VLT91_04960 [Rhizomicrobium sp.]|nr:hypothetical protein [Rhizomicrobium sp.]
MADTVVTYSMSGKSRQTAQEISDALKVPLISIVENHRRKYNFSGFIGGILDSAFRRTPAISLSAAVPLSNRIILCGPIWAGRIAGPIRTWLTDQGQQIADLVWVPHSGQAREWPKAIEEIELLTGRAPDLIEPFSEQDFAKGVAAEKARSFAHKLAERSRGKIAA